MAPSVEKKIAELEMGLLHLQQNIDIPEITLTIHPNVATVIKKCGDEGRKSKVADFGDKVEDATFLNALQGGVNRWIREIQKVSPVKFGSELWTGTRYIGLSMPCLKTNISMLPKIICFRAEIL